MEKIYEELYNLLSHISLGNLVGHSDAARGLVNKPIDMSNMDSMPILTA